MYIICYILQCKRHYTEMNSSKYFITTDAKMSI